MEVFPLVCAQLSVFDEDVRFLRNIFDGLALSAKALLLKNLERSGGR